MIRTLLLFSFLQFAFLQGKSQEMLFKVSYDTSIITGAERVDFYLNKLKGKHYKFYLQLTIVFHQSPFFSYGQFL